jgi:hypothetical protein
LAFPTIARPSPVLPEVASTSFFPGVSDAAGLGVADQVGGDAILDRAEGIVPLELGVNLGVPERHNPVKPDQRSRVFLAGSRSRIVS